MLCNRIQIRPSAPADAEAIAILHEVGYGRDSEARLALALLDGSIPTISLVADCDGRIVGHVLFSSIDAPVPAVAVAPLSVAPDFREMQVGALLMKEGLRLATEHGYRAAFAFGDIAYYERFGFRSALADSFDAPWRGRRFMALELADGALDGVGGTLRYPPQFHGSDY